MNARKRFLLALAILAALVVGPFALTLAFVWIDMDEAKRALLLQVAENWLPIGTVLTAVALVAAAVLLQRLGRVYVRGLAAIAEELDVMRTSNPGYRIQRSGPPEVQAVIAAANQLAAAREAAAQDIAAEVERAKASLALERNRLAALMAQLDEAVIVCNAEGRVLLYNDAARVLAANFVASEANALARTSALGLGRSVFALIDPAVLGHALQQLTLQQRRQVSQPRSRFVIVSATGRVARVLVAPVTEAERGSGFVLVMHDVTDELEREAQRGQLLFEMTEGNRASLANVAMASEMLRQPDLDEAMRERFLAIVSREVEAMRERLERAASQVRAVLTERWPLEPIAAADLMALLCRFVAERVGVQVRDEDTVPEAWLEVDAFTWLRMVASLAQRLKEDYEVGQVRFRASIQGEWLHWDLVWRGGAISSEIVSGWELEPVRLGKERYTFAVRDVLERHNAAMWFDRFKARHEAFLRFALPRVTEALPAAEHEAVAVVAPSASAEQGERPVFFDFDLFSWQDTQGNWADQPLRTLAYTVFDTETTGLRPSEGDEIIQIGAVRIVNGRILRHEAFEQLVDPRRPLDPASIPIHGIQPEMLVGQPTIDVVLPAFHRYAEATVLVAHNAAFDMAFLRRKEEMLGIRFDQPVLDTLLLGYVVFPNQTSNRLEALAERFHLSFVARHNALGDALVTAEVFLKLLPLLEERGIVTLRQALEAAQKTQLAKLQY